MTCKDTLQHKEFRWLVDYLAERERAVKRSLALKDIPYHEVIPDAKLCEAYPHMLHAEGFIKAHIVSRRDGARGIDVIWIYPIIHALAREAKEHEKETDNSE